MTKIINEVCERNTVIRMIEDYCRNAFNRYQRTSGEEAEERRTARDELYHMNLEEMTDEELEEVLVDYDWCSVKWN